MLNRMTDKFKTHEMREKSAAEIRKMNKPLMEKKRRERINKSLNQLKNILMDATKKDSSYYSKLEKADILEMTVAHLKILRDSSSSSNEKSRTKSNYASGYNYCLGEVNNYLGSVSGVEHDVRRRLLNHMNEYAINDMSNRDSTSPNTINKEDNGYIFKNSNLSSHTLNLNSLPTLDTGSLQCSTSDIASTSSNKSLIHFPDIFRHSTANLLNNTSDITALSILPSKTENVPAKNMPVLPIQLLPAKLPNGMDVFIVANIQNNLTQSATNAFENTSNNSINTLGTFQMANSNAGNITSPLTQNLVFHSTSSNPPLSHAIQPIYSTINVSPMIQQAINTPIGSFEEVSNKNIESNTVSFPSWTSPSSLTSSISNFSPHFVTSSTSIPVPLPSSQFVPSPVSFINPSFTTNSSSSNPFEFKKSPSRSILLRTNNSFNSLSSSASVAIVTPNLHIKDTQEQNKNSSGPIDLTINSKRYESHDKDFLSGETISSTDIIKVAYQDVSFEDEQYNREEFDPNNMDSEDEESVWRPWHI